MTSGGSLWTVAAIAPVGDVDALEAAFAEIGTESLVAFSAFETAPRSAEFGASDGAAALRRIEGIFSEPPDLEALRIAVARILSGPVDDLPKLVSSRVPDEDWVTLSQSFRPAVKAGRFTVFGAHDARRTYEGGVAIRIDAGQAFGTGHHETTFGCLLALEGLLKRRGGTGFKQALDLGCGSGVLAIALAKVAHRDVLATDIDPVAVATAQENAEANGVGRRSIGRSGSVRAIACDGLDHAALRKAAPFDLLFANILAEPLIRMAPKIGKALAPGGCLVLSGILLSQEARVIAAYRLAGLKIQRRQALNGWAALTLKKGGGRGGAP